MARKRVTNAMADVFGQVDQYTTVFEGNATPRRLSLFDIRPDPDQPRRLLPPHLYDQLFAGAAPEDVLVAWLALANQPEATPLLKQGIEKLQQLAGTIQQHGLINPITVRHYEAMPGAAYLIITGERRWWAHVYLHYQGELVKGETAVMINATIAPNESVRVLQLIENMSRDDLTAFERAVGLHALYDELQEQTGSATWTQVEKLLSISRSYRTRIANILRLSNEAQALVRDYTLSERAVRPITDNLAKHPDLQVKALNRLISWQEAGEDSSYTRLKQYVTQLLAGDQPNPSTRPGATLWATQLDRQVHRALKVLDKLDDQEAMALALAVTSEQETRERLTRLRDHIEWVLQVAPAADDVSDQ